MPTTSIMNSTAMALYVGGVLVGESTDAQLQLTEDIRDTTNKTSGGWRENLEGLRSWSMSASGMYNPAESGYGFDDIFAAINTRTAATGRIASDAAGDKYYEGSVRITSATLNSSGAEGNVTFDIQLEGSGVLSEGDTV